MKALAIFLAALALFALNASAQTQSVRGGALGEIAGDAIVVVGSKAPKLEVEAAELLVKTLQPMGLRGKQPVSDDRVIADLELAASHHLIVVGREDSNNVLKDLPSHWIYDGALHGEGNVPTPLNGLVKSKGFNCAGYGCFMSGDIGYVEWDRNPYWHYAQNLLADTKKPGITQCTVPYRQIVRITGNSPAAVVLAANAALKGLLTGVVIGTGTPTMDNGGMWSLSLQNLVQPCDNAPDFIPKGPMKEGDAVLSFAGWHMADAMLYSGFADAAGKKPAFIWRAKYLTEKKWDVSAVTVGIPEINSVKSPLFEATMARRATGNEVFVALMASEAEAREAADGLEASLSKQSPKLHVPWTDVESNGVKWRASKGGLHIATAGSYVVMESFDLPHNQLFIHAVSPSLKAVKK